MRRGTRNALAGARLVLALTMALLASACGEPYSAPRTTTTSTTRPPSLVEITGDGRSATRGPSTTEAPTTVPTEAPLTEPTVAPETTTRPTLIDREKLKEQVPNLGAVQVFVQSCIQATAGYALLHTLVLDGAKGAAEAAGAGAELKPLVPSSLHDELDTVVAAVADAANDLEPKIATKPGYNAANGALSDFFDGGCVV